MFISPFIMLFAFAAPPDGPATAIVVATQTEPTLTERIRAIKDWNAAVGVTVLDQDEVLRRLTGQASPELAVDLDAMKKRVADAAYRESHYDDAGALVLREEVLRAYDRSVIPNSDFQTVAARALHDMAGNALGNHQTKDALDAARMAQRRFPGVPLDTIRHNPNVEQLFRRAFVELKRSPLTDVTITTTKPGTVMADGVRLGQIETTMTVKMSQGNWLFWIDDLRGKSLMHPVTVGSEPITVNLDFALETSLSWTPVPTLRCDNASPCNVKLRELAKRAGVTQAVGLSLDDDDPRQPATGTFVRADDGTTESRPLVALGDYNLPQSYFLKAEAEAAAAKPDRFSGWSVVPYGVGQYAKGRYVVGGIFTALGVGFAVWHVSATNSLSNYLGPDAAHRNSLRNQQNLSAGLLIGVGILSIGEAIYWGARHPTYPDNATTPPIDTTPKPLPEATMGVDAP